MALLLIIVSRVLTWTPVWLLEKLAWVIAILSYDIIRLRRQLILRNLAIAFPHDMTPKMRRRVGRQSTYNFALTAFEFLRGTSHDLTSHVEIRDQEILDRALSKGQGAYLLALHMGNWEALGSALSRRIRPTLIVVKKVGNETVNNFVAGIRRKNGFLAIERHRPGDAYRAIRSALNRQEIIGFVLDQSRPGEPRIPFFNEPAQTNTSLAAIWRRIPAPIIPIYIERTAFGRHIVTICSEVVLQRTDDAKQDAYDHSQQFNLVIEHIIKKNPEQYFWLHNRWK